MLSTFQDKYGAEILHAWGMTELSPPGTLGALKHKHLAMSSEGRCATQSKQGRAVFGVDMKVVGAHGQELPWDGVSAGELLVRGPWVVRDYFRNEGGNPLRIDADAHGWFPTGDIATIDADGFMQITDRSKDVIKSGGEWISSIDIENVAGLHPEVASAVCIAAKHPKWDERPLLLVVKKPGSALTGDGLLAFFEGKLASCWKPDAVLFVDDVPLGATGKVLKNRLRDEYTDYYLSA